MYIHYDGNPGNVVPTIALFIRLYGFSEFVKQIRFYMPTGGTRALSAPTEMLNSKKIVTELYSDGETITGEYFGNLDYAYVVNSKDTIKIMHYSKHLKDYVIGKLNWTEIEKEIMTSLFDSETKSLHPEDTLILKPIESKLGL
jgi:hypothetical protein